MRELHVVALSEDGRSVLLATSRDARTGGFRIKIDDRLAAALRGELPRPGEVAVRDTSVSPKEIQYRMRAGESAEQIAASAGVPVARVDRFAGPVLSERERIIDQARAASLSRGRLGPSRLTLGDAVASVLANTPSLRPNSVTWETRRLASGHWLVQLSYVARARSRAASWVFDPSTRSLAATDPASAALGHAGDEGAVRSTRRASAPPSVAEHGAASADSSKRSSRVRRPAATAPAAATVPAKRGPAKEAGQEKGVAKSVPVHAVAPPQKVVAQKVTATSLAAKKVAAKKVAAKKVAAKKVAATKVAAKKVAATKVAVAPVPTAARTAAPAPKATLKKPAVTTQPPVRHPSHEEPTVRTRPVSAAPVPSVRKRPVAARLPLVPTDQTFPAAPDPARITRLPEGPPNLRVVPAPPGDQPPVDPDPAAGSAPPDAPAPSAGPRAVPVRKKRAAGERATVPDWADVLFGAAPRRDRADD